MLYNSSDSASDVVCYCWGVNDVASAIFIEENNLIINIMEIGTKVTVNLKSEDARKLGINGAVDGTGVVSGNYPSDVPGHYVTMNVRGKIHAIADKYNAVVAM